MASCSGNGSRGHHKFTLNVNETYVSGGADNYSTVSWSLVLSPIQTGWDWNYSSTVPVSYKVTINGTDYTGNIMSYDGRSTVTIRSGTQNVTHNNDGTKAISFNFSVWDNVSANYLPGSASGNGNLTLTTIARYTSITSFTVSKRNETSLVFNWGTANTVDYLWYSTNNGSSWTGLDVTDGTSGNFTVSGLSPNTTYNCKIRVRRQDSQLTTDSSTVAQTTYKAPSQSLNARTETTIKMNWAADTTANHIWYSTNNGSSWVDVGNVNATSGNYTISGLNPNTTYNIKTRVRRSSTNTTYDTSASSQTTYDYPYVTAVGTAELLIGNQQTLTLYNPLGRSVTVRMNQNNASGTQLYSGTTSGTSISFTPNANTLYASIPNNQSGVCVYSVVYGSVTRTTGTRTYKIRGTETPTFNDFTYIDSNTAVTNVTGNNQIMVKGISTVQVTISSANKMVAQNSATAKSYAFTMAGLSGTENYSSSDIVKSLGTINASGTQRLTVTAYDSRNLTKAVYKDVVVYDYNKPVINATITRANNFENETTIKVNGTYNKLTINNTDKNNLTSVQYRYRESNGSWGNWINSTTTVNNGTFTCSDVILSLDNTKSFDFEIRATDSLQQTTTNSYVVDVGKAAFFIKESGGFESNGNSEINGNFTVNGISYKHLQNHGDVPDNDFNKALTNGTYKVGGSMSNGPLSGTIYGVLEVYESRGLTWEYNNNSSWIWQTLTLTDGRTWFRTGINSQTMSGWRRRYDEYSLYDSSTGTSGEVTLSDSAANYSYLEIYSIVDGYTLPATKIYSPQGKVAVVCGTKWNSSTGILYVYSKGMSINGTSMTVQWQRQWTSYYSQAPADISTIKTVRVVGYK